MNIEEVVTQAAAKVVQSGKISEAIEQVIEKTVVSTITNQLERYSDFGKAIDEAVKQSVKFKADELPSYNDLIVKCVRNAVQRNSERMIAEQVEKQVEQLFAPPPESCTLTSIIEEFVEKHRSEGDCVCYGDSEAKVELRDSSRGFRYVHLYESSSDREASIQIGLHKTKDGEEVFSLRFKSVDVEKEMFVDNLYGLERKLFQMKAERCKIEVDDAWEDVDLSLTPEYVD